MSEIAGEFIRALGHFVTRDTMYLVGGGSVCVTLLHVFGQPLTSAYPTAIWLLAAGVAYGVGYAVQEILSLFQLQTTAPVLTTPPRLQWLYRRFTRTDWTPVDPSNWSKKMQRFDESASDREYTQLQRIIGLKHIGSTLGSNWLVCGIILIIHWLSSRSCSADLILAIGSLVLSVGLVAMSWVKGALQTQYVWNWSESSDSSAQEDNTSLNSP